MQSPLSLQVSFVVQKAPSSQARPGGESTTSHLPDERLQIASVQDGVVIVEQSIPQGRDGSPP
jgi:hypothetical protein